MAAVAAVGASSGAAAGVSWVGRAAEIVGGVSKGSSPIVLGIESGGLASLTWLNSACKPCVEVLRRRSVRGQTSSYRVADFSGSCTAAEGSWRYTFTRPDATHLRLYAESSAPRYRTTVFAGTLTRQR